MLFFMIDFASYDLFTLNLHGNQTYLLSSIAQQRPNKYIL